MRLCDLLPRAEVIILAYKGIIASQMSLKRLFNESFYTIDYYQREYVWGEDEVRALITDLRQSFAPADSRGHHVRPGVESQYFLGSSGSRPCS
jgi:uncharacterized protein with ParB-like and HNH nuclease domain